MINICLINLIDKFVNFQFGCIELAHSSKVSLVLENLLDEPIGAISTSLDVKHYSDDREVCNTRIRIDYMEL